ncbi:AI-2E family transporter [Daejeonella oryzae]|uniref:AI-2E family transporter n=1 Tax=Daejeonella oryzae TaxID=1122943 RepID=UPI0004188DD1|nr:AI-2E family transporter [Daejeonella oryzae]
MFSKVTGIFSSTIGVFADIFIILITGLFLAADPRMYTKGFTSLFPVTFRNRLSEVLDKVHVTLTLWMAAKLISMAVVGILTAIGLVVLGIPLSYALALIAALLSFITNIGPYLALAPALLIAFMSGPQDALYVLILYFWSSNC